MLSKPLDAYKSKESRKLMCQTQVFKSNFLSFGCEPVPPRTLKLHFENVIYIFNEILQALQMFLTNVVVIRNEGKVTACRSFTAASNAIRIKKKTYSHAIFYHLILILLPFWIIHKSHNVSRLLVFLKTRLSNT